MATEQLRTSVEIPGRKVLPAVNGNSMPKPEIPSNTAIIPQELINVLADNNTFLNLLKELKIYNIDATRKTLGMVVRGNLEGKTVFSSNEMLTLFPEEPDYSSKLNKARRGMHSSEKALNRFGLIIDSTPKPTTTDEKTGKEVNGFYLYTLKKQETPVKKSSIKPPPPLQPESNGKTPEGESEERTLTSRDLAEKEGIGLPTAQDWIQVAIKENPNLGEWRRDKNGKGKLRRYFNEEDFAFIIARRRKTTSKKSSLSSRTIDSASKLTQEEIEKKEEETAKKQKEAEDRRRFLIEQVSQASIDFIKAILLHLESKPLGDLSTDIKEVVLQSSSNKKAAHQLTEQYTPDQVKTFIFLSSIKFLSRRVALESAMEKHGGIEGFSITIKNHFSIPVADEQIKSTIKLLRNVSPIRVQGDRARTMRSRSTSFR